MHSLGASGGSRQTEDVGVPTLSRRAWDVLDEAPLQVEVGPADAARPPVASLWTESATRGSALLSSRPEKTASSHVPSAEAIGRRRRRLLRGTALATLVLALVAGGAWGWLTANRQAAVAAKWQKDDLAMQAADRKLSATVRASRAVILGLDGRVASLKDQVTKAQDQLSASKARLSQVATAKEKAKDQNVLLTRLLSAAGTVSSKLESCVTDLNSVWSELVSDMESGFALEDPYLTTNVDEVTAECRSAEAANVALQAVVNSASGQ